MGGRRRSWSGISGGVSGRKDTYDIGAYWKKSRSTFTDQELRDKTFSWLYPGDSEMLNNSSKFIENDYHQRVDIVWDASGKLLARKEADEYDTPGFEVADFNWYVVETALPWKVFGLDGPPAGETWRFVVAIGQQDGDVFREIEEVETDWHGGGGETSDIDGPDPDVYDLAGAGKKTQEAELGSFDPYGQPGDPDAFATIKDSYLTVLFAK